MSFRAIPMLLAAVALACGVLGGLARLGPAPSTLTAIEHHGPLLLAGFLGAAISLARAMAIGRGWPWLAPLAAGLGAVALLFGLDFTARELWVAAPIVYVVASGAARNRIRLLGAAAWSFGSALFAMHGTAAAVLPWWFGFVVLTLVAERVEALNPAPATRTLTASIALLFIGALASTWRPEGVVPFGAGLVAIAVWLFVYGISRPIRFASVAAIWASFWLAAGGACWAAAPFVEGLDDLALHALGLGFAFPMIFAVLVARGRLADTPWLHAPLALLNISLAWRALAPFVGESQLYIAGLLNTAAIALFAVVALAALPRRAR